MVQKVKLKKELNVMSNILRWMVITIGQKRTLLKLNHTKEEQPMIAAVKWLNMLGTSEPQRNKRKRNNGRSWNLHDLREKYKLNEQPLKTTEDRKLTSGWIFGQDSNMGRTDVLYQMGITNENRMRNKTNGIFHCIWFLYGLTCNGGTIFLCIPI